MDAPNVNGHRILMLAGGMLSIVIAVQSADGEALKPSQKAEPVRVALFAEAGCTDARSREAVFDLLSGRTDIEVEKVTSETVRADQFMEAYDVFLLPGGTGSGEANAVGAEAGKAIANAVKGGKGIVAICAGGYYLAEGGSEAGRALDIVNAKNHDGEHWARGEGIISVELVGTSDGESSHTMWYENGPLFKPAGAHDLPGYTPLVRYVTDMAAEGAPTGQMAGKDAVIAAEYGSGRVVAFGPHPELSPGLQHWLHNAVKWAAGRRGAGLAPSVEQVLGEEVP